MPITGGFSSIKPANEQSKEILTHNYDEIIKLHDTLGTLELCNLLENHKYSSQIVAGINYKFYIRHSNNEYIITIWSKFDNTYKVSLSKINQIDSL